MTDTTVKDVPMEGGLELRAIVGLDHIDAEREPLECVVDELDRRLLVQSVIEAQDAQPGAVVDGGELIVTAPA